MGPLGFYNLCLKTADLEGSVAFYERLGFARTGEDAPGLRVSVGNGTDVLTFMTFLDTDVINFRGAHVHRLMTEIEAAGLCVTGYNERPDQQPLMVDEAGVPLPENACGHFTVHDPDGHELFFNTHPWERAPFEAAVRGGPAKQAREGAREGQVVYCVPVADLTARQSFYETLGLRVEPAPDGAWVTPHPRDEAFHFTLRLRVGDAGGPALLLQRAAGDRVPGFVPHGDGWIGKDPDGRPLETLILIN